MLKRLFCIALLLAAVDLVPATAGAADCIENFTRCMLTAASQTDVLRALAIENDCLTGVELCAVKSLFAW